MAAHHYRCTGITLGEGSGVVVVESYEHAKARNAKMYCEVLGAGVSSDAHHITAPRPDGEGQMEAINRAIKNSGLKKSDIGYVFMQMDFLSCTAFQPAD